MDSDLQGLIAASFLSPYWQERVKSSPDLFYPAFTDSYLRCMQVHPEGRIKTSTLARRLRKRLGARVSIMAEGERRWATARLEPITAETIKSDLDAVKQVASKLGTHA